MALPVTFFWRLPLLFPFLRVYFFSKCHVICLFNLKGAQSQLWKFINNVVWPKIIWLFLCVGLSRFMKINEIYFQYGALASDWGTFYHNWIYQIIIWSNQIHIRVYHGFYLYKLYMYFREDTHNKKCFSGRTTNVRVPQLPPPQGLVVQNNYIFFIAWKWSMDSKCIHLFFCQI